MKIAFFCSSRSIIPPLKTGSIEQSAYYFAKELVKKGHEITIYAAPGTKLEGVSTKYVSPFPTFVKQKYANFQERITSFYDLMALSNFFSSHSDRKYDLIYYMNYIFYEILPFANQTSTPIMVRINYPHDAIYPYLKKSLSKINNVYYLPISNFIQTVMPGLDYLDVVYDGVDFNDFSFSENHDDYLLFVGRICADKGTDLAVQVALKSNNKLIIAGSVYDSHRNYFNKKIKPFIDNKKITYVGEVGFLEKIKLYQGALATLFPIQWNEPTGTVIVESMACGTPVIAFDKAAIREMVKDGESGFIVQDGNTIEMVKAIRKLNKLSRKKVRVWAKSKFSIGVCTKNFESVCKKLIK